MLLGWVVEGKQGDSCDGMDGFLVVGFFVRLIRLAHKKLKEHHRTLDHSTPSLQHRCHIYLIEKARRQCLNDHLFLPIMGAEESVANTVAQMIPLRPV